MSGRVVLLLISSFSKIVLVIVVFAFPCNFRKSLFISMKKKLFKDFIHLFFFREGEGREKERERNINVWLPVMWPPPGTWPET